MFEIWSRPLEVSTVLAAVSHPGAGAVDVFLGVVRDANLGKAVSRLEYEAYEPMASRELARIGAELAAALRGTRLAAVHRVGSLAVGEVAVVCAASAPHRAEAFEACRRLIDTIKARVPIWKREWGPDGPHWVGWQDARCAPGDPGGGHARAHGGGHAHGGHSAGPASAPVRVVTVTVSDTRTAEDDASGAALRAGLAAFGCVLVRHAIVPDEPERVRAEVVRAIDGGEADAVVTTGGTGVAPRDTTYEAIDALLEKKLDGVGEAFRRLSWDAVGPRAVLSRAVAGTYRGGVVAALPGSPAAVELGVRDVLGPVLAHAVALARR